MFEMNMIAVHEEVDFKWQYECGKALPSVFVVSDLNFCCKWRFFSNFKPFYGFSRVLAQKPTTRVPIIMHRKLDFRQSNLFSTSTHLIENFRYLQAKAF